MTQVDEQTTVEIIEDIPGRIVVAKLTDESATVWEISVPESADNIDALARQYLPTGVVLTDWQESRMVGTQGPERTYAFRDLGNLNE